MTDNETRPVWLSPDGKVWSTDSTQPYMHDRIYKMIAVYDTGPLSEPPADTVPLVRADECGCDVGLHETVLRADRDRWKAECEKAQAERDELQRCNDRQKNGLRQMDERLREVYQERDEWRFQANGLQETAERQRMTIEELRQSAVDPDPTSASRRLLAAETLEADPHVDWNGRVSGYLRREAEIDQAAAAREQERDALIGRASGVTVSYPNGAKSTVGVTVATALADAGLLSPDDRNELGQA